MTIAAHTSEGQVVLHRLAPVLAQHDVIGSMSVKSGFFRKQTIFTAMIGALGDKVA